MAKQAKQTQTDWTRGGKAISDTAIPLYQSNLTRMDDYLQDPMAYQNKYLTEYFTNTPTQNDFRRSYLDDMSKLNASNYAATGGGVASQNQKNYDQYMRDYNDAMARLYEQGVTSSYNMANQDFQNMLGANTSYYNAYNLGKPYSDVEQYNYMADQVNSNWWAPVLSSAGSVISAIPHPATMAIGGAMQGAGSAFTVDDSALRGMQGTANQYGMYQNAMNNAQMGDAIGALFGGVNSGYDWLRNRNFQSQMNNGTSNLANLSDVNKLRTTGDINIFG